MEQLVFRTGEIIDILIATGDEGDAELMREVCELMMGDIVYRNFGYSKIKCAHCSMEYTKIYPVPSRFPLMCDVCGERKCFLVDRDDDIFDIDVKLDVNLGDDNDDNPGNNNNKGSD